MSWSKVTAGVGPLIFISFLFLIFSPLISLAGMVGTSQFDPSVPGKDSRDLPTEFSWGDYNGHNWVPSPDDQGLCASCWAFCIAHMYETRVRLMLSNFDFPIDISEEHMVECWHESCGGANPAAMLAKFVSDGCTTEECYPYIAEYSGACTPCAEWEDQLYFISDYTVATTPTTEEIRQEIYDNGPVVVLIDVYPDFQTYTGGVYEHLTGSYIGAKALLLYGWSTADACWYAQNTWGTSSWGEIGPDGNRGWLRIRMGVNECGVEDHVYSLTPSPLPGCCVGLTGNVNADGADAVDISDLTRLVNHLFVTFVPLPCPAEANVNGDTGCNVDISDLTKLVNNLFVTFEALAPCNPACE